MANIAALEAKNAARWAAMHITPSRMGELNAIAHRILAIKPRLLAIEQHLVSIGKGVPWFFTGIVDEREAGLDLTKQLGQGDPLGALSRHDPAGRGPFFGADAFERSCYDALIDCAPHAAFWQLWTPGGIATIFEEYNGLGYADMGVPSAYVFSGSDQYVTGKYIRDHVYRANVRDVQEGCMPILKCLMALDPSIKLNTGPGKWIGSPSIVPAQGTAPVEHGAPAPAETTWLPSQGPLTDFVNKVAAALGHI